MVKDNEELVRIYKEIYDKKKTAYGSGCIGWTLTKSVYDDKCKQYPKNKTYLNYERDKGKCVADCSGAIVGIAYDGWTATTEPVWSKKNDWNDQMLHDKLTDTIDISGGKNTDKLMLGMCLWKKGHVGLYIGDGYAFDVDYDSKVSGIHKRKVTDVKWTLAGKLPNITYIEHEGESSSSLRLRKKSNEEIAKEVIAGKWGVMPYRKERLEMAGYDYREVQDIVNAMINGTYKPAEENTEKQKEDDGVLYAGKQITLNKTNLYYSSDAKQAVGSRTGVFYIWSDEVVRGRIRITNVKDCVGKKPWVTGWINTKDIR